MEAHSGIVNGLLSISEVFWGRGRADEGGKGENCAGEGDLGVVQAWELDGDRDRG